MAAYNLFEDVAKELENFNPEEYAPEIPKEIRLFLGRLSMLYDVPSQYLVPDEQLLQKEISNKKSETTKEGVETEECGSLRFFFLDPEWIQCLLNGALSIGPLSDVKVMLTKAMGGLYLSEAFKLDVINRLKKQLSDSYSKEDFETEMKTRLNKKMHGNQGKELLKPPPPESITSAQKNWRYTGFLLRSSLVSGWKGLEVQAKGKDTYDGKKIRELQIVRWERLADDTIFCLCEGFITEVVLIEPPEGLHFGINGDKGNYFKIISGISNPKLEESERKKLEKDEIKIPFRDNEENSRVLNIKALTESIGGKLQINKGKVTSKEIAVEMVSKPIKNTVNLNWEMNRE